MQTAVYLSNRVPHAALGNITPYRALYGKDVNLGHLRAIGARAFVHVETHTRKFDPRPGKDVFTGTAWKVSHSASTIQPKGMRGKARTSSSSVHHLLYRTQRRPVHSQTASSRTKTMTTFCERRDRRHLVPRPRLASRSWYSRSFGIGYR